MSEAEVAEGGEETVGQGVDAVSDAAEAALAAGEIHTPATDPWELQVAGLPPELRDTGTIQNTKSLEDAVTQLVNAQDAIGRKGVVLPKEGDEDDLNRYYNEVGRPETVDGYELGDFAPPEGMPWDDSLQSGMLGIMHGAGLTNDQVRKCLDGYAGLQGSAYADHSGFLSENRDNSLATLKKEWGSAFQQNTASAVRAFNAAAGGPEAGKAIALLRMQDGTELGDHPAFIAIWHKVAEAGILEDGGTTGTAIRSHVNTPGQAEEKIGELQLDEKFMQAYLDSDNPGHAAAQKRMEALHTEMYGSEPVQDAPTY